MKTFSPASTDSHFDAARDIFNLGIAPCDDLCVARLIDALPQIDARGPPRGKKAGSHQENTAAAAANVDDPLLFASPL